MGREIRRVQQARPALEACASGALADDPHVAGASIGYRLRIGPAGQVEHAEILPAAGLSASARACLGRVLGRVQFDLPGSGGRDVAGAIVFGLDAPGDGRSLPQLDLDDPLFTSHLWPLILDARARPPEEVALARIVRAAEGCSARDRETALRVRGLVAASGALFDVEVAPASSNVAACVRGVVAGPRPPDAKSAIAIDVGLGAEFGKVRLAR
jgi:hypothetical protein